MPVETFKLTLRPKELLELYPESKGFITFWRRNQWYLLIVILLVPIQLYQLSFRRFDVYAVFMSILLALVLVPLIKAAITFIDQRKAIFLWVEDCSKFEKHSVELSDTGFAYVRDNERFDVAFTAVTEVIQNSDFIYILHGKENIIFPAKSFEQGEYDRFVQEFRKRKHNALHPSDTMS